jgi:methionyl-tRNA formyltransferase
LRVVFAGTPAFAAVALEALASAGHEIALVLTQPDRPSGRGMRLAASAVSEAAAKMGIAAHKPVSLRDDAALERLRAARAQVMVVAAYGQILPREVLAIPPLGCINIHASLLPRWRGAAPIHRALLAGDESTGISIMQMDEGLDTGPVLFERSLAIGSRETTGSLTAALAALGGAAIVEALGRLPALPRVPQDPSRATYAGKISRAEAGIDWTRSNREIDRQVRAFDPFPGAQSTLQGEALKVWACELSDKDGEPGTVVEADEDRLLVACASGSLRLLTVQRAGGRRLSAVDFLRGTPIPTGTRLGEIAR